MADTAQTQLAWRLLRADPASAGAEAADAGDTLREESEVVIAGLTPDRRDSTVLRTGLIRRSASMNMAVYFNVGSGFITTHENKMRSSGAVLTLLLAAQARRLKRAGPERQLFSDS